MRVRIALPRLICELVTLCVQDNLAKGTFPPSYPFKVTVSVSEIENLRPNFGSLSLTMILECLGLCLF